MTFPPFPSKISCYVSLLILVLQLALNIHKLYIIKLILSSYFYVHESMSRLEMMANKYILSFSHIYLDFSSFRYCGDPFTLWSFYCNGY